MADVDTARALEMATAAGVLRSHAVDSATVLPADSLTTEPRDDDSVRVRCLKLLLRSTDLDATHEWGAALATVRSARDLGVDSEDRDVRANLANVALHLGDDATHRSMFTTMSSAARTEGAVMEVLYALNRLGLSQSAAGQWREMRSSAEESLSLARSMGQTPQTAIPLTLLTLLAAHQGRADHDTLLDQATQTSTSHRLGVMDGPVQDPQRWAQAVHAGSVGDTAAAFHHFDQMHVPGLTRLASTARVAAAVRSGEHSTADGWTQGLERFADATGSSWAQAAGQFGRALLADPQAASAHFEAALARHQDSARPYDRALVMLSFGEHLRRSGRRVEARTHLKKALETFRDLQAEPLVERASQELRASGESARKRDPSTLTQLTPTELQIAQLVAQGLTTKEVAEQCWVSPRTVAFHLRTVFTKTGISSRAQLARLDLG